MGLNEEFKQIRSHILLMEKLPNLGKVYSMIVHEKTQQHLIGNINILQGLHFIMQK